MTGEGLGNGVVHKINSTTHPGVVQVSMPKNNHTVTLADLSVESGERA